MVTRFLFLIITAGFLLGECVSLPVHEFGRLDVLVYDAFWQQTEAGESGNSWAEAHRCETRSLRGE